MTRGPRFAFAENVGLRFANPTYETDSLRDLATLRSNRLERLTGNRLGLHSIRINQQWRICFRWEDDGPYDVEIVDYHR